MKILNVLLIVASLVATACGATDSQSELNAITSNTDANCVVDPTYRDEYDCGGMTRVTSVRVLDTLWNGPASGQFIADIKNVDVTREYLQQYIGSGQRLRYQVFVRSWVDLGAKTLAIAAINKDDPTKPLANKARRVGKDPNGQTIYMLSIPAIIGDSIALYLTIEYQNRTHYSNVGRPHEFFEVHTRGI